MAGFGDFRVTEQQEAAKKKKVKKTHPKAAAAAKVQKSVKSSGSKKSTAKKSTAKKPAAKKSAAKETAAKKTVPKLQTPNRVREKQKKTTIEYRHRGSRGQNSDNDKARQAALNFWDSTLGTFKKKSNDPKRGASLSENKTLGPFEKVDASTDKMLSLANAAARKEADKRLKDLTEQRINTLSPLANPMVTGMTPEDVKEQARKWATEQQRREVHNFAQREKDRQAAQAFASIPFVAGPRAAQGVVDFVGGTGNALAMKGTQKYTGALQYLPEDTQNAYARALGYDNASDYYRTLENRAVNFAQDTGINGLSDNIGKPADKLTSKLTGPGKSVVETTGDFSRMAGYMLPSVAINRFVPGAGYGASAISYGGNAAQQAYENGATFDEAVTIGEIEGLKSAAIDKVLGKVGGKGKGAFDKIFNLGSGKKLVDTGKRIVSEGMGEVADTATDPLVDRAVYNPTAPWATPEELIKSFGGGATIGTFYQIPAAMKYAKNSPAPSSRGGNLPTAAGKAARSKPQLPTIADMVSPKINGRAKPQGMGDFRKMEAERERQTDTITSDENIARYRSEVNGVFTGELPAGSIVTVGETPGKLLDYGAKPSNITMTQDTARKLAYPQGYFGGEYGLGIPALKGLPAQIQNPMAILKSKTQDDSLVLLTEWQDQHNNPVIIPLRLNRRGSIELENRWPSAPGEKEFSALLGENRENLLYTRESKDLKTLLGVRH